MADHKDDKIFLPVDFIDELSHASSVSSALNVGVSWLMRMFPTERSSISFFDNGDVVCKVIRTDGVKDEPVNMRQIADDTLRSMVIRDDRALIFSVDNVDENTHHEVRAMYRDGFRSIVVAPMRSGGTSVGTLALCCKDEYAYNLSVANQLICFGKLFASKVRLMQAARDSVRQAETDMLTGLANRNRLMHVLSGPDLLNQPDARGRVLGVLHVDLDRFKEVNDTLGHAAGDRVLVMAAAAMCDAVGQKDLVARLGGDEFVIVSRSDRDGRELGELAQKVLTALRKPMQVGNNTVDIGASIGLALAGDVGTTADNLISNADMALYEVKRNGRSGVMAFNTSMRRAEERRRHLLADIRDAAADKAFTPVFQPLVSLETGHFSGFEMLARWVHPTLGQIEPEEFIRLAVEAGVSDLIDTVVRKSGLKILRQLRDDGWDAPKMSFNASARTIGHPDLVPILMDELDALSLKPADLVLEVLENDLLTLGDDVALASITDLNKAGFAVHLDDFGDRVGSITSLLRLPIQGIKIDASLIRQIDNEACRAILTSAISAARELGLTTIAEGVETPRQFAQLRRAGCDAAQGFGISAPLAYDGLVDFMKGYGQAPVGLASEG